MKKLSFIPQLDSFRFLAATLVVLHHWFPVFDHIPLGSYGVSFFFVVSGYLISSNLLFVKRQISAGETNLSKALKSFYIRRTLRIFPLYYLVLVLVYCFDRKVFEGNAFWYFSYLGNWSIFQQHRWSGSISHFWSLAVEEQFYLVWPFVILLVKEKWLKPTFVIMTIISIALKLIFQHIPLFWTLPFCQMDGFGVGAILAYIPFSKSKSSIFTRIPFYWGLSVGLALSILAIFTPFTELPGVFFVFTSAFIILKTQAGFKGISGKILDLQPMQYLGKISYGLYVYHNFMYVVWYYEVDKLKRNSFFARIYQITHLGNPNVAYLGMAVLLVIVASLSWYLYERPLNNLKNLYSESSKRSFALPS